MLIYPAGLLAETSAFLPNSASTLQQSTFFRRGQRDTEEKGEGVEHDIVHCGNLRRIFREKEWKRQGI